VAACGSSSKGSTSTGSSTTAAQTSSGAGRSYPAKVVIGVPLDLSGIAAVTGIAKQEQSGIDFAISQLNAENYLGGGSQFTTNVVDLQYNATTTVSQVDRLINDNLAGVVGFTATTDVLAGAPLLEKASVPTISVSSGAPGFETGNYVFRVAPDTSTQNTEGIKQIVASLSPAPTKVAYLYVSDNDASTSGYKAMQSIIGATSAKTVATQTITASQTDYRAQLTALKQAKPDLVALQGTAGQDAGLFTQGHQVGLFPGVQTIDDTSIGGDPASALAFAQCTEFPTPWVPASTLQTSRTFVSSYTSAHGGQAPNVWEAQGYQSMMVMAAAIKNAGGVDHSAISSALQHISVPNILGGGTDPFTFNSKGDPTYPMLIGQINNSAIDVASSSCHM
jgi:branched-chain amino acid transport system substrate-binding protein